jgi:hypothetical protein
MERVTAGGRHLPFGMITGMKLKTVRPSAANAASGLTANR